MRETAQYLIHTLNLLAVHIHVQDRLFHEVKIYSGTFIPLPAFISLCCSIGQVGLLKSFGHLEESLVPLLNFLSHHNRGKRVHSPQCLGGSYETCLFHSWGLLPFLCTYARGCGQTLPAQPMWAWVQACGSWGELSPPNCVAVLATLPNPAGKSCKEPSSPAYTQHLINIYMSSRPELLNAGYDKSFWFTTLGCC